MEGSFTKLILIKGNNFHKLESKVSRFKEKMRRTIIILNIFFVILFLVFLLLSIFYGSIIGFFFIPLLCFLPFAFRKKSRKGLMFDNSQRQEYISRPENDYKIRYCPVCDGEIKESVAKFCYHCGSKLHNN